MRLDNPHHIPRYILGTSVPQQITSQLETLSPILSELRDPLRQRRPRLFTKVNEFEEPLANG